jgi:superfamily II DNA or RNA helicase
LQIVQHSVAIPFAPGDVVWVRQERWRVANARRTGDAVCLDLVARRTRRTLLLPFDRALREDRRDRPRRLKRRKALHVLAHAIATHQLARLLPSALEAGIDIHAYQLEPALAVAAGARRVLIADEVGLGKTIQAAVIVAEARRRDPQARVLILTPGGLCEQWAEELETKFRLAATIADRRQLDADARAVAFGDSPWRRAGVFIATLDFLKQPHVFAGLPRDPWDVLVIDEAHGACGRSDRHDAAAVLARRARHVVLLTATPHSGDETRYARLLALGDFPAAPRPLTMFRRTRQAMLGTALRRAVRWRWVTPSVKEANVLSALQEFERALLRDAGTRRPAALLLLSVFRKRALSTMAALVISLERRARWLDGDSSADDYQQPRLDFDADDEMTDEERNALSTVVGMPADQEKSWVGRVLALANAARDDESKVTSLVGLLRRTSEPVVVFTEFRDSLRVLAHRLGSIRKVAVVHGGMSPVQRTSEVRRFLDGLADTLIATDVAGQGLNLQRRSRWVVSLELPWNVARLEQRAGRVDRIGQRRRPHATLLIARHRSESAVLVRLARGVFAARVAIGGDAFFAGLPESAVAESVLDDAPLPIAPASAAESRTEQRWVRPARVVARSLRRRRRLLRANGARTTTPSGWISATRLFTRQSSSSSLLVYGVPLIDGLGSIVDTCVVALTVARRVDPRKIDERLSAAARARAVESVAPRVARLTSAMAARAALDIDLDCTLTTSLTAELPIAVQIGLFNQRPVATGESGLAQLDAIHRIEDLSAARRTASTVSAGRPVLLLIVPGVDR